MFGSWCSEPVLYPNTHTHTHTHNSAIFFGVTKHLDSHSPDFHTTTGMTNKSKQTVTMVLTDVLNTTQKKKPISVKTSHWNIDNDYRYLILSGNI